MNSIDLIVIITVSIFLIFNLAFGFFRSIALQAGIILGVIGGLTYYESLFVKLSPYLPLPETIVKSLAFILLFSLLFAAFYFAGMLLEKTIKAVRLKPLSYILSTGFGLLEGALIAGLILHLALLYKGEEIEYQINSSRTGTYLVQKTQPFYNGICEKTNLPWVCKPL